MRKQWTVAAAVVLAVVAAGGSLAAASSAVPMTGTIHVIEHAKTDRVIDTGKPGDSSGDLLTFHNPVFAADDATRAGRDQGQCIRIAPRLGTWECAWTTFLGDGHITVEGPFNDSGDSVLAITGGTGAYRDIRGEMRLSSRKGGTEFDFIFHWVR